MTGLWLRVGGGVAELLLDGGQLAEHPFAPDPAIADRAERLLGALGGLRGKILTALAAAEPALLRIEIARELESEPWETLRGPVGQSGELWLAARHHLAIAVLAGPRPLQEIEPCWPLRVLVCVGCADDDPKVEPLAEIRSLEQHYDDGRRNPGGGERVRADVQMLWSVRRPLSELIAGLEAFRPHVLHFIGHGIEAVEGGQAVPALRVDVSGARESWTPSELDRALSGLRQPVPRLVILNACGTAAQVGPRSLAETFASWGAAAVVAMVGPVGGAAAGVFSGRLAAALVRGRQVREAVREAREALPAGWRATPRLYLRDDVGEVLPAIPKAQVDRRAVLRDERLVRTRLFACRHDPRWRLWDRIERDGATVILGPPRVGKTSLACLLVERALLAGHSARYVDLAEFYRPYDAASWLTILHDLRDVRTSARRGRIDEPWPAGAFRAFDERVRALTDPRRFRGDAPEPDPSAPRPWEGPRPTTLHPDAGSAGENEVVESFGAGLAEVAGGGRLVLAIDHLPGTLDAQMFEDLLAPLLTSPPPGVHVVLVLPQERRGLVPVPDEAVVRVPDYDDRIAELVAERAASENQTIGAKVRELAASARPLAAIPSVFASLLEAMLLEATRSPR